jgi:hypothetical protein
MDFCQGAISTDFLIERGGQRIALACRFNAHRDIQRALLTAKVLRRELMCDQVITVTPFDISETLPANSELLSATPREAVERILTI